MSLGDDISQIDMFVAAPAPPSSSTMYGVYVIACLRKLPPYPTSGSYDGVIMSAVYLYQTSGKSKIENPGVFMTHKADMMTRQGARGRYHVILCLASCLEATYIAVYLL